MPSNIDPDKLYNEYKLRDDIKKVINGKEYTRVAGTEILNLGDRELFMIYIDKSFDFRIGDLIEDEKGHRFTIKSVAMCEFRTITKPDWYYNMPWIELICHDSNLIGEYVIRIMKTQGDVPTVI